MKTLSPFALAVEVSLVGLTAVSSGICPGCKTCRDELGYGSLAELETAWENGDAPNEPYFSRQACECCGSHLGGDREPAHGINENGDIVHFVVCVDCVMYLTNSEEPENWEG
ncbi:hypothetical protein LCGC14_1266950 [marine sediment metagenome]|uniref:Uncharacterized protein n=1 Tax=marine sediment metagenome TaxID=412755 RepID=A0A0F9P2E2_9ZZZZ